MRCASRCVVALMDEARSSCTEQWIVQPLPLERLPPSPAGPLSKVRFADTEPQAWLNPLIPSRSFLN